MNNSTLDKAEVEHFANIATEWWDFHGKFKPLHIIGPTRIKYICEQICSKFNREMDSINKFNGLTLLDIGCGGGLIAEPMARLGADVTAIDPANENIEAARHHAIGQNLEINYQAKRVEDLVEEQKKFDVVLVLEVVEHVPDVQEFMNICTKCVKPDGILIMSTLNRTAKSYALAIIGAEYILRWLPIGTHQWNRFITPEELSAILQNTGATVCDKRGMVYNPLKEDWSLSHDMDVNYFLTAEFKA